MKDGRTHLAYKAEQAVDLESGTILGVTVQGGSKGDTESFYETLEETFEQLDAATGDSAAVEEIVADKGYHSNDVLASVDELGVRSYIAEPKRGRRRWKGKKDLQKIVYANRRRSRTHRGKRLQRRRGERPFAHQYETGGMRRLHLRGRSNVLKRLYTHVCGCNLGLLMRKQGGVGTLRGLQGRTLAAVDVLTAVTGSRPDTTRCPNSPIPRSMAATPIPFATSPELRPIVRDSSAQLTRRASCRPAPLFPRTAKEDWVATRISPNPPATLPALRTDATIGLALASGIPVGMTRQGDGTAAREAWRQFFMAALPRSASWSRLN